MNFRIISKNETYQLVKRGEIAVSKNSVLCTNISTCVSICLYHPGTGLGGITHISRSRKNDTTPSKKYIMDHGFYYADTAVDALFAEFRKRHSFIREKSIEYVIAGGIDNEGPVSETLEFLKGLSFKAIGCDTNINLHRYIRFDTSSGTVVVSRNKPFSRIRSDIVFSFTS